MAKEFYTNYTSFGNDILLRYVDEFGQRKAERIKNFRPKLYVPAKNGVKGTMKSIYGDDLVELPTGDIRQARDTIKEYSEIPNMKIYGYDKWPNQFIASKYKVNEIEVGWNADHLSIFYIDIETECEKGFPDPQKAEEIVNIISFYDTLSKQWYVFGLGSFFVDPEKYPNALSFQCADEMELLTTFVHVWERLKPDIVTGWNIEKFDIPYLCNRINKLFSESMIKRLSPWGRINSREVNSRYGKEIVFSIVGVAILDMMELYKKFVRAPRSSYKLDNITKIDLNDEKLKHPSGIPGHLLYKTDFQSAIEYNLHDVKLLINLEELRKLIQTALVLAYSSMTNYDDIMSQIRLWDNILYLFCLENNVQFEINAGHKPKIAYEGGYVKEPLTGKKKWVVSFDVTSEYPSLIMALNISPEKLIEGYRGPEGVDTHLKGVSTQSVVERGYCVAANGVCFDKSALGFMPTVVKDKFNARAENKRKMIAIKKFHSLIQQELSKR